MIKFFSILGKVILLTGLIVFTTTISFAQKAAFNSSHTSDTSFDMHYTPGSEKLDIETNLNGKNYVLIISDMLGNVVKKQIVEKQKSFSIPISDMPEGLYYITLSCEGKHSSKRLHLIRK